MVDKDSVMAAEVKVLDTAITGLEALTVALRDLRDAKRAVAAVVPSVSASSSAAASPKPKFDFTKHDPTWKHGPRLTTLGRMAVNEAFASGLSQAEVARIFKIGANSAHTYQRRFQGKFPWPYGKKPGDTAHH